ncbi:MAG: MerR family transcriptional regulator [Gaiellaceae bacterium]
MDAELLTIGEVAARGGLRTSALRFYEDAGLLKPTKRVSGQRRYDPSAVDRLTVIQFCQSLGFSLEQTRELLAIPRGKTQKQQWRELVDVKIGELEETMARAETMKAALRKSRDCDCIDVEACAASCNTADQGRPTAFALKPARQRSL